MAQHAQASERFEEINPLRNRRCAGYFQASFFPEEFEESRFTFEQLSDGARQGPLILEAGLSCTPARMIPRALMSLGTDSKPLFK
jgi:hypothetical protein